MENSEKHAAQQHLKQPQLSELLCALSTFLGFLSFMPPLPGLHLGSSQTHGLGHGNLDTRYEATILGESSGAFLLILLLLKKKKNVKSGGRLTASVSPN